MTFVLPEHPPPPIACVRPFHAPWTPPEPPSRELRGSPTRMLMFCSADSPYSMLTWQYDLFTPAAGMIALVRLLIPGFPTNAGSLATLRHVCSNGGGGGPGGGGGAATTGKLSAALTARAV